MSYEFTGEVIRLKRPEKEFIALCKMELVAKGIDKAYHESIIEVAIQHWILPENCKVPRAVIYEGYSARTANEAEELVDRFKYE